ncbi:MAG: phosphatase PAP2 family protein [Clostridia bacterium]|nr:phosphatase PAP2 family protein [Clostridia bacterium]
MEFLRFLEGIRVPVFNFFFSGVTYLGDEIMFIAVGLILYWCFEKRYAYYVLAVGLLNTLLNQTLKLAFRIPRPWVLDPDFTIVESARAAATGYSFPSGHTQNAVGIFGALGLVTEKKWLRAVFFALIILIPFSRMYLGVHTPLDVGAAFAVAAALSLALYPCFKDGERAERSMPWVLSAVGICSAGYFLFALLWNAPADTDAENLASGQRTAYIMLAVAAAIILAYILDKKVIRSDTGGSFLTQTVKVVPGLGLTLAIKALLKAPLYAIVGETFLADGIRYFIVAAFASCVWPLTFPLIRKICEKKRVPAGDEKRG